MTVLHILDIIPYYLLTLIPSPFYSFPSPLKLFLPLLGYTHLRKIHTKITTFSGCNLAPPILYRIGILYILHRILYTQNDG